MISPKFKRFVFFVLFICIVALLVAPFAVFAQDASPTPPPVVTIPATFDLQASLATVIAFLLYALTLAGAVTIAVDQLKPLFLDPVKNRKDAPTDEPDNVYLLYMYVFRTTITTIAYLYLWGGVAATRAVIPLVAMLPDTGVAIITIALVVLGEQVIHPLLDRLYALRDTARLLAQPFEPLQPIPAQPPSVVNVNVSPDKGINLAGSPGSQIPVNVSGVS